MTAPGQKHVLPLLHPAGGRPRIVAHRGDSARAPENTLLAAAQAQEAGADAWELDVHLTRDRVPVVLHDDSLRRTTNVARRFAGDPRAAAGYQVADFDLAEVRALDAGSWFVDPAGGPRSAADFGTLAALPPAARARFASGEVRIPTLEEALRLVADRGWQAILELKAFPQADAELVDATLAAIRATRTEAQVLVASFDHAAVARVVEQRVVPAGVLMYVPLERPVEYVRGIVGADAYLISAQALGSESLGYRRRPSAELLRRSDLEGLRRAGMPVLVYTVNDPRPDGLADHLAAAGVTAVMSDDPGPLIARWRPPWAS